jgi:hypothetical protein
LLGAGQYAEDRALVAGDILQIEDRSPACAKACRTRLLPLPVAPQTTLNDIRRGSSASCSMTSCR